MPWAILDTNVYIDHWQGSSDIETALASIRRAFIIRHSSVVLSELRRGARTPAARRLVNALHALASVQWCPTAQDWWSAGELIRAVGDAQDWEPVKRQRFQNDVLVALTARRQGATLVTRNRSDFELVRRRLTMRILYV